MSFLMRKLLSRVYREEEKGGGDGAAAPAATGGDAGNAVDWGDLNDGVDPGADDGGEQDEETPAATKASGEADAGGEDQTQESSATTGDDSTDSNSEQQTDAAPPENSSQEQAPTAEQQAAQQQKLEKDFTEWRQAEIAKLEKVYAFDAETAARLQTEPEVVLPRLAAELELRATQRALEAVQRLIPQIVPQVVQGTNAEKEATAFFYGKNPDLKKYHAQVVQAGEMFRKLNPKATREEAAEKIGNMVRTAMGLPPLNAAKGTSQAPAQRSTPAKPAGAGARGSAAAPAPKAEQGIWADLAADDD